MVRSPTAAARVTKQKQKDSYEQLHTLQGCQRLNLNILLSDCSSTKNRSHASYRMATRAFVMSRRKIRGGTEAFIGSNAEMRPSQGAL